ncbi:hypothetical protein Tco_1195579 [Tanacetum coccineum]
MILGSLKKFKKRSPEELKPRSKDTRRTSGNTTRNDPFPPFLIIEAQTQICVEIDDTWAWVALGPERQPDAAAGAPEAAEDAPVVDGGDQGVLAPIQAPPPPPAAARTMPQRMARLEEDVHKIRGALAEQREVIGAMARDFSRFTVWAASGIA